MPHARSAAPPSTAVRWSGGHPPGDRLGRSGPTRFVLRAAIVAVCVAWWGTPAGADGDEQVARGAAIFGFSCAACHGATGAGFEEAVAAFPEDHRTCTRCHHPTNAPQMPGSQVGLSTMAFSLGSPPPLTDGDRLVRFGSADALFHFVRATMPRWAPGSLDDRAYRDVTAYLLHMADGAAEPQPSASE